VAGDAAGSESAAVDIGGDDSNNSRLARTDERLRDSKRVEEAEAGAADVKRAAIFAREQTGMKLCGERRVIVMRFAGGNDPVELMRAAGGRTQGVLRGRCAERQLAFPFGGVGDGFNARAFAKLAKGHAEGAIDFLGRNDARTGDRG